MSGIKRMLVRLLGLSMLVIGGTVAAWIGYQLFVVASPELGGEALSAMVVYLLLAAFGAGLAAGADPRVVERLRGEAERPGPGDAGVPATPSDDSADRADPHSLLTPAG